ncbi:unnamed protein product [Taenia asiatica]|uniref:Fibulin-2 n=1 Tax=Taenia asiatica TaxID=60517 RepID=A0A158R8F6_TAEAS|nr:unnamed protein product [Taenia asiatica]
MDTSQVMLPKYSLPIRLLCVCLLIAALFIPPSACRTMELSFAVCCGVGINSTHDMELDALIKDSNSDECIAIKQVDQIFKEVVDVNAELSGDQIAKCLQVKRGCFYAAKANIFCENAARSIYSPDDKLTPISHFSPDLLKSPRDCCERHDRLPALDVVSDDSMDFDINGVPLCCTVKGYEVPDDLDPFANAITTRSSEESYESPTNSHGIKSTSVTVIVSVPTITSTVTQQSMSTGTYNTKSYMEHGNSEPFTATVNSTRYSYAYSYSTSPPPTSPSHSPPPSYSPLPSPQTQRSTEAELVCEPGFTWNPEKQLCLHTLARCPKGMYLSVNQSKCLPKIGDRFNCPPGYEFRNDMNGCEDIDECKVSPEVCKPGYECRNVIGSFQCIRQVPCGFGYVLNSETQECEGDQNIDECKAQPDICGPNMICVNVRGGMNCELFTYNFDHSNSLPEPPLPSTDINECELNATLCRAFERCTNRPGDYICEPKLRCEMGFQLNANGTACDDIDECKLKAFNCRHGQICVNTPGAYKCEPSPCHHTESRNNVSGYVVDINECEVFRPEESCPDKRARCVNTAGSYRCICPNGFVWHSYPVYACRDVNECVLGIDTCGPEHQCVNEEGGYHCECAKGYRLNWDNRSCIDINECAEKGSGALCQSGICVNTIGSFHCDCPSGFRLGKGGNCVEYECNTLDPYCLKDRPLRIDHLHIELPSVLKKRLVLGELDSSVVRRGTVNVELLEHYAYDTRTKRHISLAVKASDRRTVELLLVRPIEPPADIFVSVRLSEMLGQRSKVRSNTRFYLYATENNNLNSTAIGNHIDDWRSKK